MTKTLINKQIVLVVTGSIAAYKSPDIIRSLQELGAQVRVILTNSGARFITQQTLQTTSKNQVHNNLWDKQAELAMGHIELAKWADLILIAPASANSIATLANAEARDLFSAVVLASKAQIVIATAMNVVMFNNNLLQQNLTKLTKSGMRIVNDFGKQVCGDTGNGRLADIKVITQVVSQCFKSSKLSGKKVVITAGSTEEPIDPVRFISNHSSGKMGVALANACVEQGAEVVFIYGAIKVELPSRCTYKKSMRADDMYQAVMAEMADCDVFIATAAVADYQVKDVKKQKIAKSDAPLTLTLLPNKDILKAVCLLNNKPFTIGFGAQTEKLIEKSIEKYKNKGCDILVANDVSRADIGFNSDDNEVLVFYQKNAEIRHQKKAKDSKPKISQFILDFIS